MKRILASIALLAGFGNAQLDVSQFNVMIRDFQPSHPDFENFDDRWREISTSPYPNTGYAPFTAQCFGKTNPPTDPNYWACEWGYPCGTIMPSGFPAGLAWYGEYKFSSTDTRKLHRHEALALAGKTPADLVPKCGSGTYPCYTWEDPVYVTRGMVQPELYQAVPGDTSSWVPKAAGPICHNTDFDQWFTDVPGINTTTYSLMNLSYVPNTYPKLYRIDSRDMPGGSYFPLDSLAGDVTNPNFGKQSLKIWCPPYGAITTAYDPYGICTNKSESYKCSGGSAESGADYETLCTNFLNLGGPKNVNAAAQAVAQTILTDPNNASLYQGLLHNYAFTIAGFTQFVYNPTDTFMFSGDDDMWIFIDGHLVADLGGTHNPAEARVVLSESAAKWGWATGSSHYLHFFYADRQTDGSNLQITTTMAPGLVVFGAPKIMRAERDATTGSLLIYTSTQLSDASVVQIAGSSAFGRGYFPIVGIKYITDSTQVGGIRRDTVGMTLTSMNFLSKQGMEYVYEIKGALFCTDVSCIQSLPPSSGDSLAFNFSVANDAHEFASVGYPNITSAKGNNPVLKFERWGVIGASTGTTPADPIKTTDNTTVRPSMPVAEIFTTGTVTTNGVTYNGLGAAGDELPITSTGEVGLALYPANTDATSLKNLEDNGFGMPPIRTGGAYGGYYVDTTAATKGYYQYTSGPQAGLVSVAHCSTVKETRPGTDSKLNNSCLSVSFDTERPFSANVMVYDHLGNFVSHYQTSVTGTVLKNLQNKNLLSGTSACAESNSIISAVSNGKVRATLNIYPFSQTGRKLGDGVYILHVDLIQQANKYCSAAGGAAQFVDLGFTRTFQEVKLPYIRQK